LFNSPNSEPPLKKAWRSGATANQDIALPAMSRRSHAFACRRWLIHAFASAQNARNSAGLFGDFPKPQNREFQKKNGQYGGHNRE
jgi:hypothetical protein